jgi:hypothetical protein
MALGWGMLPACLLGAWMVAVWGGALRKTEAERTLDGAEPLYRAAWHGAAAGGGCVDNSEGNR